MILFSSRFNTSPLQRGPRVLSYSGAYPRFVCRKRKGVTRALASTRIVSDAAHASSFLLGPNPRDVGDGAAVLKPQQKSRSLPFYPIGEWSSIPNRVEAFGQIPASTVPNRDLLEQCVFNRTRCVNLRKLHEFRGLKEAIVGRTCRTRTSETRAITPQSFAATKHFINHVPKLLVYLRVNGCLSPAPGSEQGLLARLLSPYLSSLTY